MKERAGRQKKKLLRKVFLFSPRTPLFFFQTFLRHSIFLSSKNEMPLRGNFKSPVADRNKNFLPFLKTFEIASLS